ncbi:MAG: hypothetical protein WCJ14_08310, partial [Verrucomicrobiota bacterium]
MTSPLHALQIGTLATWLSVAGFGAVGVLVPDRPAAIDASPGIPATRLLAQDFTLGGESSPAAPQPPAANATVEDALPAPASLPD